MKIFAVGMNYADHNKEMAHTLINESPVIFMKGETSLLKDRKPFFLPDFSKHIEYETELVVRIDRLGKSIAERFAHRYYHEITVGIDFTARDLQRDLRAKGLPWELAKSFDSSAAIGSFISVDTLETIDNIDFGLKINGEWKQQGCTKNMIFNVDRIISYISRFFTLKIGDLIFTGTPSGVGQVHIGDHLEGFVGDQQLMDFYVR